MKTEKQIIKAMKKIGYIECNYFKRLNIDESIIYERKNRKDLYFIPKSQVVLESESKIIKINEEKEIVIIEKLGENKMTFCDSISIPILIEAVEEYKKQFGGKK